jgi:pimeloyl-ACP methyl ester carboxylesterase
VSELSTGVKPHLVHNGGPAKRTLLVIHGGPDWDGSYLAEPVLRLPERRVLLPDLRGCGRSPRAPEYTPDLAVGDLIGLLDDLGAGPVDVLGFSYGGLLAQRLTLTAPDRVRRLIIASSTLVPVPSRGPFQPDPAPPDPPATPATSGKAPTGAAATGSAGGGLRAGAALSGADATRAAAFAEVEGQVVGVAARAELRRRLGRVRFSGEWLAALRAGVLPPARVPDAVDRLAALGLPVLLLHGAEDTVFPADAARTGARLLPNATAVVLPAAGHQTHIDQPQQWLNAVAGFLDQ